MILNHQTRTEARNGRAHTHAQSVGTLAKEASVDSGEKRLMPTTVRNDVNHSLLHFHVCVHCGSSFRREEVEGRVHMTGIFLCPECGTEGPLNIEILETGADESQPLTAE